MNSNPTTLSVDEQIKEIYWTFRNENENKEMIKSLIRQVITELQPTPEQIKQLDKMLGKL